MYKYVCMHFPSQAPQEELNEGGFHPLILVPCKGILDAIFTNPFGKTLIRQSHVSDTCKTMNNGYV